MSTTKPRLAALAVVLLTAGCGRAVQTTTTSSSSSSTRVASTSAGTASRPAAPRPAGGLEAALATGPGVVGDTSQTAALSAPANPNGTTPPRGVIPRPSR